MELHLRAEINAKKNQELEKSKMVVKRVSVDKQTKEFSPEKNYKEASPNREAMGMVRKYVKDLKNHQKKLKNAYLQNKRPQLGDIAIKGFATGSDFYPHNGMMSAGNALNQIHSVHGRESISTERGGPRTANQASS